MLIEKVKIQLSDKFGYFYQALVAIAGLLFAGGRNPDQNARLEYTDIENCRMDIILFEFSLHPIHDVYIRIDFDGGPLMNIHFDKTTPKEIDLIFLYEKYEQ